MAAELTLESSEAIRFASERILPGLVIPNDSDGALDDRDECHSPRSDSDGPGTPAGFTLTFIRLLV